MLQKQATEAYQMFQQPFMKILRVALKYWSSLNALNVVKRALKIMLNLVALQHLELIKKFKKCTEKTNLPDQIVTFLNFYLEV